MDMLHVFSDNETWQIGDPGNNGALSLGKSSIPVG
jgi:hypothetical protein